MKNFLLPGGIFLVGMILVLISTIFNPAINTAVTQTQANISSAGVDTSQFYGLDWSLGSARLLIFVIGVCCVLLSVFAAWLKRR